MRSPTEGPSSLTSSVQLPEDVDLMILEVENLIQSMVKDQLDSFETRDFTIETETRSLYHQTGHSAPVFIQN